MPGRSIAGRSHMPPWDTPGVEPPACVSAMNQTSAPNPLRDGYWCSTPDAARASISRAGICHRAAKAQRKFKTNPISTVECCLLSLPEMASVTWVGEISRQDHSDPQLHPPELFLHLDLQAVVSPQILRDVFVLRFYRQTHQDVFCLLENHLHSGAPRLGGSFDAWH